MKHHPEPGHRVRNAVQAFLQAHDKFAHCRGLVIGVSGGPDSACLLHAAASLQAKFGLNLHAAHLSHGMRGHEADEDDAYVARLAASLGVTSIRDRIDVATSAKEERLSIEDAGRHARYDFFAQVCLDVNAQAVLVGHTADDQVETVLLNLTRGAGLAGLAGMRATTTWQAPIGEVLVGRPLLSVNRADTESYCEAFSLEPRMDSTNESRDFVRNRIRHQILPLLRDINPGADAHITQSAVIAGQANALLTAHAQSWIASNASSNAGRVSLPRRELNDHPHIVTTYILREALRSFVPNLDAISERHLEAVSALTIGPSGRRADLPGGSTAMAEGGRIVLGLGIPSVIPIPEQPVRIPGTTLIGPWRIDTRFASADEPLPDEGGVAHLDVGAASDLAVRSRKHGDRFQPLGLGAPKKLQDFFVDEKIPRHQRDGIPLLLAHGEIVWGVGHRMGERAKVRDDTQNILRVEFSPSRTTP